MRRFFILLLFPGLLCFSQEKTQADVRNLTKITFLDPGFIYEARVGKLQSLSAQAFMRTSAYFSWSSSLGSNSGIYFDPAAAVQYRYYYNAANREAKSKRTEMNSMNYVGAVFETVFTAAAQEEGNLQEDHRRPVPSMGVVWGLQRNGEKRFSFDLNLGLGYLFARGTVYKFDGSFDTQTVRVSKFTGMGQLSLGFWLNRK